MFLERLKIHNESVREFLAEFLGTFVLTTIGCSANAFSIVANEGPVSHVVGAFSWGMALTAAIYVCGGVSGGHVNPAVTLGMASVGKLPWLKIFHYFAGQYLGAFLGASVTYLVYHEAINESIGYNMTTAAVFGTFPHDSISTGTVVADQIVATAFFLLIINAITDDRNMACVKGLVPIAIGITDLGLLIFAFGFNCGAPINPARDFAPRLFTAMAGWGGQVFSGGDYYFWVPIVCCHIGGILGSWMYRLFIELHWPETTYDLTASQADEKMNTSIE